MLANKKGGARRVRGNAASTSSMSKSDDGKSQPTAKNEERSVQLATPTEVWWDYENAPIPYDVDNSMAYHLIVNKLKDEGFNGPVTITIVVAYKDSYVPTNLHEDIKIIHVKDYNRPKKGSAKNQFADYKIKKLIKNWLARDLSPQNAMLITGDKGFKKSFEALRKAGHKTLLVYHQIKGQNAPSGKLYPVTDFRWNLRPFFGVSENTISKKTRSAQYAATKAKHHF